MGFQLDKAEIEKNIKSLKTYMNLQGLDSFYISSFDSYLNEYVPMIDCHRFYLTGFSGSVAEVLVPIEGNVKIYVDGRYHEQADIECEGLSVDVVKVPQNQGIFGALLEDLKALAPKNLGLESDRVPLAYYKKLENSAELKLYSNNELYSIINFQELPKLAPIKQLSLDLVGKSTKEKLDMVIPNTETGFYITAIDSLAWLTNCRGYHLPNLSSFLGKALAFKDKVFVFIDEGVEANISDDAIEFISVSVENFGTKVKEVLSKYKVSTVNLDETMVNTRDFLTLKNILGEDALAHKEGGLVEFHSIKDEVEMKSIKDSFKRADKAIYNTIRWVKDEVSKGNQVSELDLNKKTSEMYKEQGAVEQSFGTISGADANGSIIHYSDPKADVILKYTSMVLLDSGGYFESGFATDTTRTFMAANDQGSAEQKKIYTLVLKGTLNLQNAVFKAGTRGSGLDAICRQPLYQAGYDFAHGTGHGVGIHVHEGGAGIGPTRNYLLKPGQVISIEPGIYVPGFAGVRIENIGVVVEHPKYEGFLTFESLVYIGFDPLLIDESLLNDQEKTWLEEYEAECVKRGTSFLL